MEDKKSYREILWPVLLVLLLGVCFWSTARILWRFSMDECYYEIEQATDEAAAVLRYNLELYEGNLELAASLLTQGGLEDAEALRAELDSISGSQRFDALCVQFQDGRLVCGGSALPDRTALPSFEQTARSAPWISGRFPGVEGSGAWFLCQAVPIQSDGQVAAILYGLMDLERLPSFFEADMPFNERGQICLVDGDTGDLLMDVWHETPGNLYDDGMEFGETRPGYSVETMRQDLRNGRPGYIVFTSGATGESLYIRYQPTGINHWSIALIVPESVAFAEASGISQIILFLGVAVTVITAFCLFITLRQHRRRLLLKQAQIRQTTFMFQVQQTLFGAHQDPDLMVEALKKVAEEVRAEGAFLLALHSGQIYRTSLWRREDAAFVPVDAGSNIKQDFPQVYQCLLQNRSVMLCDGKSDVRLSPRELEQLRSRRVRSVMITPALDTQGTLYGVLCAMNFQGDRDAVYRNVECVANSFIMAMCNMESYRLIHDMGTMDALTGLKNRNSYEAALPEYKSVAGDAFHCIYIDVNGLHELNNQRGHKAGDTMLRFVANSICYVFGTEHTYRIGGDEFVAFSLWDGSDIVAEKLDNLRELVETEGYHISIGSACWQDCEQDMDELIARAEGAMYDEKRAFYRASDRRDAR
ncbi:MAG TPA: sensor domain-containing diguanylate cyclase [Candidatus Fournierella merdavium]|nr:sensor domain-containing diguanylate cyclase [Candidatus Fournierella merdavium]